MVRVGPTEVKSMKIRDQELNMGVAAILTEGKLKCISGWA